MQLTLFTDFALRVLIYLSQHDEQRATMKQISEFYGISIEHLRKVVHSLSRAGYIETFRGKSGGMRLARPAAEINIGELVYQFEGGVDIIDCAQRNCILNPSCILKGALKKSMEAFYQELEQYTLADIVANQTTTQRLQIVEVAPS